MKLLVAAGGKVATQNLTMQKRRPPDTHSFAGKPGLPEFTLRRKWVGVPGFDGDCMLMELNLRNPLKEELLVERVELEQELPNAFSPDACVLVETGHCGRQPEPRMNGFPETRAGAFPVMKNEIWRSFGPAGMWETKLARASVVGALTFRACNTSVELSRTRYRVRWEFRAVFGPRERRKADAFLVLHGTSLQETLEAYARAVPVFSRPAKAENPAVWSTWFGWREKPDPEEFAENAQAVVEQFGGLARVFCQIDLGWMEGARLGEVRPNERFRKLKKLARRVRKLGGEFGLWVAPLVATEKTPAFDEPSAFVKKDGKPHASYNWALAPGEHAHPLDPTSKRGRKTVRRLFKRTLSFGAKYVKTDFLNGPARNLDEDTGVEFADRSVVPGTGTYRAALTEAFSKKVHVLRCSSPLFISQGLAHSMRIGVDSEPGNWEALKEAIQTLALRYYTNRSFWWVDVDGMHLGPEVDDGFARISACLVAFSGGAVLFNGKPVEFAPERTELGKKCLPPLGIAARPLEIEAPWMWELHVEREWGEWSVLWLVNMEESEAEFALSPEDLRLKDKERLRFWSLFDGEELPERKVRVPGRSCAVVRATNELDRPFVLATDMHTSMGGVELKGVEWNAEEKRLAGRAVRAAGETGKLFVGLPEGGLGEIELDFSVPGLAWSWGEDGGKAGPPEK